MIAIVGATGNTARPAVEALLAKGEQIRVIGRDAGKLQPFVQRGAAAAVGNIEEPGFLAQALDGAQAAYLVVPQAMHREDFRAYQERITDAFAESVAAAGVQHVISLSSLGAQHPSGTGPIAGLHNMEQKLNAISDLNVLHLRPAQFMENLLVNIGPLRSMGVFGGAAPANAAAPWIAAGDVGTYAAARLVGRDFSGSSTQELLGPRDVTMNEIASILGEAIGKPRLMYSQVPIMMLEPILVQTGLPKGSATLVIEMFKAGNAGLLAPSEPRSPKNTTPTTIESFIAQVLAPAYLAARAGA